MNASRINSKTCRFGTASCERISRSSISKTSAITIPTAGEIHEYLIEELGLHKIDRLNDYAGGMRMTFAQASLQLHWPIPRA